MNRYSFRNKDDRNKDETSIRYAREKDREIERKRERIYIYHPTVIILRVPSIKIPDFFAQHRPERDRHSI
jgi:hypothetical protein